MCIISTFLLCIVTNSIVCEGWLLQGLKLTHHQLRTQLTPNLNLNPNPLSQPKPSKHAPSLYVEFPTTYPWLSTSDAAWPTLWLWSMVAVDDGLWRGQVKIKGQGWTLHRRLGEGIVLLRRGHQTLLLRALILLQVNFHICSNMMKISFLNQEKEKPINHFVPKRWVTLFAFFLG